MALLRSRRGKTVIERLPWGRRAEVDKALLLKSKTVEEIGRELGCSGKTVQYYHDRVLKPVMLAAQDTRDSAQRKSARERMSFLYADADQLLQMAKAGGNIRDGVSAVKALHEILRTEFELEGELNRPQVVSGGVLNAEVINVLVSPKVGDLPQSQPLPLPLPVPATGAAVPAGQGTNPPSPPLMLLEG